MLAAIAVMTGVVVLAVELYLALEAFLNTGE